MNHACHICSVLGILVLFCVYADSFSMLSRPGEINCCIGDDAIFDWAYDNSTYVSMKFWLFLGTGQTMVAWYENGQIKFYGDYQKRINFLEDFNAGIVLKNVTHSDEGEYRVELAGPGHKDVAKLSVYDASDLAPNVTVNDIQVQFNDVINVTNYDSVAIALTTAFVLPANITLHVKDHAPVKCHQKTRCDLVLQEPTRAEVQVLVFVNYGICEPAMHNHSFYIIRQVPVDVLEQNRTGLGIGILLAVICSITLFVILYIKGFHRKTYGSTKETPPTDVASLGSYDNISITDVSKSTSVNTKRQSSETTEDKNKSKEEKSLLKKFNKEPKPGVSKPGDENINLNIGVPIDMNC